MTNPDDERVTAVEKVSGGSAKSKAIEEALDPIARIPPDKEHFDGLMKQDIEKTAESPVSSRIEPAEKISPMDQIREINTKVEGISRASADTIASQASDVIKQIEEVKTKLATSNVEIKGSVQTLLNNKLSHIDESLKVALNRAGIEYTPHTVNPKANLASPIEKFIGLLTHGQYQLQRLSNDVSMIGANGTTLTPANMLALQIKVGYIQQEVELFTNVLNKALESIKTIMNVQI